MTAEIVEIPHFEPKCEECGWHPFGTDSRSAAESEATNHDALMHPHQEEEDA